MSPIAIGLNLFLAVLLLAALAMGWRLNGRLRALRDSHDSFAKAVAELNWAAQRAEQGLADLRAATDEATDALADRIAKARELTVKLDRLADQAPKAREASDRDLELRIGEVRGGEAKGGERLGALLAAARTSRPRTAAEVERLVKFDAPPARSRKPRADDDLFDEPLELGPLNTIGGGRR